MLFREWVSNFNPNNFTVDEWGFFNPPEISQDDERDDELNFIEEDDADF